MARLTYLLVFLLFVLATTSAEHANNADKVSDGDWCMCEIATTDWSKRAEYRKLGEVRQKLKGVESLLEFINFSAIFNQLENVTVRLNDLEADLHTRAIATIVTSTAELVALHKNVAQLMTILETADMNWLVADERARLGQELEKLLKDIDDIWVRNQYRQGDKHTEVSELRERFSIYYKRMEMSPFQGDLLSLNTLQEDWCPTNDTAFRLGEPVTHKWNVNETSKGMWFKDPQPLTNNNRTEIWSISYAETNLSNGLLATEGEYPSLSTPVSVMGFSTYKDFVSSKLAVSLDTSIRVYGAVIFRNALYYSAASSLVKQDLTTGLTTSVKIGFRRFNYNSSSVPTFLDLKVDEFGLWVVYSISTDNRIVISNLDPDLLIVKGSWLTGMVKSDVCLTFMICGKLYAVVSCSSQQEPGNLNYVFDTETSIGTFVQYYIPSKYGDLTYLAYNPRERMLFAIDNGYMVTYTVGWGE